MAISGVPVDKLDIMNALIFSGGRIAYAARHIPCEPQTIYSWIERDKDVQETLKEARRQYSSRLVEKALGRLEEALDNKEGPEPVRYVLDVLHHLGREYGWKAEQEGSNELRITINPAFERKALADSDAQVLDTKAIDSKP